MLYYRELESLQMIMFNLKLTNRIASFKLCILLTVHIMLDIYQSHHKDTTGAVSR